SSATRMVTRRAGAADAAGLSGAGLGGATGVRSSAWQIASQRSVALIGLVKYAAIPSALQRETSPSSPDELSIMIVEPARSGRFAIWPATSNPSNSGML